MNRSKLALLPSLSLMLASVPGQALAQTPPERIPFAGGALTIEETPDYEKILSFDGKEIARDYFVFFDRIAEVSGTEVAFVSVGPGGNACAPAAVMIWKDEAGELATATHDEDCNTPSPSVSDNEVLFVPYLLPGETADVRAWSPDDGFRLRGALTYVPQPGTDWEALDVARISHPLDLFDNADVYAAAEALLGEDLTEVATGLGTAARPETSAGGLIFARGCVPHACGVADSFVVVDAQKRKLYFASQDDEGPRFWPARDAWPADAAALVPADF